MSPPTDARSTGSKSNAEGIVAMSDAVKQADFWQTIDKRTDERNRADLVQRQREALGHGENAGLPREVLTRSGGGQCNNMTPATSNWPDSAIQQNSVAQRPGGIDWLAFGASVVFAGYEGLREELEAGKAAAKEAGGVVQRVIGGLPVTIRGYGTGPGKSHRHYLMHFEGVSVQIRDSEPSKQQANVFFELRGSACLRDGIPHLLERIDHLLKIWNGTVGNTWVSRVDLCADVPGLDMAEAAKAFAAQRYVRCTSKAVLYYNKHQLETLVIGAKGADCQCRIYNKLAELAKDKGRWEAYKTHALGGEDVQCLTRIEFQLRREKLRELHVVSLGDLLGSIERLCGYLSWKWIRFTPSDKEVNRTNTTRSGVAEWWQAVRGHFEVWSREWQSVKTVKRVGAGTNAAKMVAQAIGCLKRAAAETLIDLPQDIGLGAGEDVEYADAIENPTAVPELVCRLRACVASNVAALNEQLEKTRSEFTAGVVAKIAELRGLTAEQTAEWFEPLPDGGLRFVAG